VSGHSSAETKKNTQMALVHIMTITKILIVAYCLAVKRLIAINRIQNKSLCLHNTVM